MKNLRRPLPLGLVAILSSLTIFFGYSASRFVPPATAETQTFIVFNTNDGGAGSLRQAIISANGTPGLDRIEFILPQGFVNTIVLFSPLPIITDPVFIDGYSQIGANQNSAADGTNATLLVEISGANSPTGPCMTIDAGGSTVRGLIINRCRTAGLRLRTLGGNTISGNFIGTNAGGTGALANTNIGLDINNSPSNIIGGTTLAARNLISGNNFGMTTNGAGATGNVVSGNLIGTDRSGNAALGNFTGVFISAANNTIGGLTAAARNIISGNILGIELSATMNVVQGNYIGTNAVGTAALGNNIGVVTDLTTTGSNLIGGTVAGARNIISGNAVGLNLRSNATGVNTRVEGNFIGTAPNGTTRIANSISILISDGSNGNVIGGTAAGQGNLIAVNSSGIIVGPQATGNSILSNSIFADRGGIDLNDDSVTANDAGDGDFGGNNLQNYPILTSVSSAGGDTTIGGTFNSTPNSAFRIEFFSNSNPGASGFAPGESFIGSTSVNTDANGDVTFSVNTGSATAAGRFITSTATNNVTGDTSEFSAGVLVNGPDSFQFSQPAFTVSENAGVATITVTRVNAAGGGATVNYAVTPALATHALDFELTFGTLTFAAGETSKTFTVPIFDDVLFENEEFASAFLSNPSMGTVLGTLSFADLNINDREQTIYGITALSNSLISFERAQPQVLYSFVPISGLQFNERILGIDFRPSNGLLYGLGSSSRLYTINATSGLASEVGSGPFSPSISGLGVGFDFDPVADVIRVVSSSDINFRLDPDTGAVAGSDTTLAYNGSDPNAAANPNVVGAGYTNNTPAAISTTVYGIDSNLDTLVRIGSPGGTPNSSNSGQLSTIGPLGFFGNNDTSLDIVASDKALAALSNGAFSILYNVNLLTGSATPISTGFSNSSIGGFSLVEPVRAISAATNGSIGFSSATANVSEGAGKVQLTLNRTGDISGAAAVELVTSDGPAVQISDYNISFATVFFAPGEASKTVDVFITNDGYTESNETFTVGLANPQGGFQVGGITGNTVTINDNDTVPSVINPIEGASFFVRQHYVDFLNREPDTAGLNFWTNEITSCGANAQCIEHKRINVSAAFFLSIEFQRAGAFVYLTHKAAVGTNFPGPAAVPILYSQFEHDAQTLQRGLVFGNPDFENTLELNKQAFLFDFVTRPQFEASYPNTLTPAQFVDALITNTGATIPASVRTAAINKFGGTSSSVNRNSRANALRVIVEAPAFATAEFNRMFVAMQYFGYLRRDPDASGFNFWLNKLNGFNGNFIEAEMVKAFISSTEYRQRFGAN